MVHPSNAKFLTCEILTLVICGLGLIGNVICAIVLFSRYMGRSSYVYLLQGLTISDICLLTLSSIRTMDNLGIITLPTDVYTTDVIFFWDWIFTTATKYFTVAISLERFFVITYPLLAHRLTSQRSQMAAGGIALFSVLLSGFSFIYQEWIDPVSYPIYVAVVLHFVPFIAVVLFNILIFNQFRKIQKQSIQQTSSRGTDGGDESVTKMLVTVVLVFGICYSFETVRRIMNYLWPSYMVAYDYYEYTINNLSDIFYVLNSSANLIIYSVLGRKFRAVFCTVFGMDRSKNTRDTGKGGAGAGGKSIATEDSGVVPGSSGEPPAKVLREQGEMEEIAEF